MLFASKIEIIPPSSAAPPARSFSSASSAVLSEPSAKRVLNLKETALTAVSGTRPLSTPDFSALSHESTSIRRAVVLMPSDSSNARKSVNASSALPGTSIIH